MSQRTDWIYPTAFPCWGPEEKAAIMRVVDSGNFTMGVEVEALECEFAAYHDRRYAIAVNSGSSANLIAVAALVNSKRLQPAVSAALVPALAWATTYAPLVQHGLGLLLADCDATWNAHPQRRPSYVDPDLIVTCPVLGNPAHQAAWLDLAASADLPVLEDCCESLGARTDDGELCGTFGLLSTFSFYHSHQIGAVEGGMILTDDHELAVLCRMLRSHGWTRGSVEIASFEEEYDFRLFGYNVRPTEIYAAVAREQLKKLDASITARRKNAIYFAGRVQELHLPIDLPYVVGHPSPFGMAFTLRQPERRLDLVAALRKAGIDCRLPTGGSFRLHAYGSYWAEQQTPFADSIHRAGMFIGNAPFDISDLIDRAISVMREVL